MPFFCLIWEASCRTLQAGGLARCSRCDLPVPAGKQVAAWDVLASRRHDAAPVVLERAFYDDIMAKRITDKMAPKATGALLKATAKFKQLARKARAEVARRPHVRRLPSSQDGQVIRDATREDKIAAGKALLGQRLAFLALRMVEKHRPNGKSKGEHAH